MPQKNWKQGTHHYTKCKESYSRPGILKFDILAQNQDGETIPIEVEVDKNEHMEFLEQHGNIRVGNVLPFVKVEDEPRQTTQFRRAAAGD